MRHKHEILLGQRLNTKELFPHILGGGKKTQWIMLQNTTQSGTIEQ